MTNYPAHHWPGIRENITAPGKFIGNTLTTTIPDGDAGTVATLAAMTALIDHARDVPAVRELARRIMRNAGRQNFAIILYRLLKDAQEFMPDPRGQELCRHPVQLVEQWNRTNKFKCDCDDVTMLACSLLAAIGIPPMMVVYRKSPATPFVHVAWGFHDPVIGERVPLDSQEKIEPGILTTRHYQEYPI